MINTSFIFDGKKSAEMGLHIVRIDSGLANSAWAGSKDIIEEKTKYKDESYFYGVDKKPIKFQLTFSLLDEKMTDEKKFELARWLFKDDYKEFQTSDNNSKRISVIGTNQIDFVTSDNEQGYWTIEFRASTPYWFSSTYSKVYDLSQNTTTQIVEIANKSNAVEVYYPEIEFLILEGTDITLKNLSDGGKEFSFTGLQLNETVYVNNGLHQIMSDLNLPRLSNFNKNWLGLVYGINRIEITGKCKLNVRCKFPLYL